MSKSNSKTNNKNETDVDFLLKTIDEKNEQMTRLQNKFRDVTHAYKSLLEEKKAYEITIKALKTSSSLNTKLAQTQAAKSSNLDNSGVFSSSRSVSASDLSEVESTVSDTDNLNMKLQQVNNLSNQDDKIAALTSNIQLLISNKSKLEQNFQAERKKLRSEYEELNKKFEDFKLESEKSVESYELRIKELRTSLKQSQSDREKLTADLNMMLKAKSAEQENKILSMHEENQTLLLTLRNENNDLKLKLKNLTKQFENKCEEVVLSEKEFKSLKDVLNERIKQDENLLNELRQQLKQSETHSELRISSLENRITELVSLVGRYENGHSLNDYKSTSHQYSNKKLSEDIEEKQQTQPISKLDFDSAIEQISQLKTHIEKTAKELNINFNFNEIWLQNGTLIQNSTKQNEEKLSELLNQIEKLKDENRHLKEEYEKYKIRTNYLIKSAKQLTQSTTASTENEQQLNKLKEEIESLKNRLILNETKHLDELKRLKQLNETSMCDLRADFKLQIDKLEHERFKSVGELEKELVKQRERTIKLLEEKDNELKHLRKLALNDSFSNDNNNNNESSLNENDDITHLDDMIINKKLGSPHHNSTSSVNPLIYFNQEAAYKETELNKLRLAKNELEYKLKQTLDEHSVDIDRLLSQINLLKQEIERLKLNQTRVEMNGPNLEYIKNVVFNYMTTKDVNVKHNMQQAITQILHFTKSEKQRLNSSSSLVSPKAINSNY